MTYTVTTWFDQLMAVALAANAHADRHPRSPINRVFVEELELPPSSKLERVPDSDLVNPNEWR